MNFGPAHPPAEAAATHSPALPPTRRPSMHQAWTTAAAAAAAAVNGSACPSVHAFSGSCCRHRCSSRLAASAHRSRWRMLDVAAARRMGWRLAIGSAELGLRCRRCCLRPQTTTSVMERTIDWVCTTSAFGAGALGSRETRLLRRRKEFFCVDVCRGRAPRWMTRFLLFSDRGTLESN